ncbi:Phosphatidylglycerol/phosphatidylinositol transfer protein [Gnomoniopsis smithogilvyi]|uniref:Phosphatidylglycerol/phosphatidylinositol transfer protein n=1 Tax=Gnomoniopsis smithogilvyi TaxID=1191159 RepID=A0A9W8Z2Q5_9PEZI|nr:Phosphatidylglycerol/phosphatidylinositol transfer protein [Gnomoniopsis smithogilvyi]
MKLFEVLASCALALTSAISCAAMPLNDTVSLGHFDHQLEYQNVSSLSNQLDGGPMEFVNCHGFDGDKAGFAIGEIALSPNPPIRGQDLNITIKGDLRAKMDQGAVVKVKVWKFGIAFAKLTFDWCENIQGISCPVEPGPVTFFKTQNLDRRIPLWTFSLSVEVFNAAGDQMSCLVVKAKVSNGPKLA